MGNFKKKGFTLIEVIISIAILLIIIVPISTALIVSTGTNKKSADVINGTKLAEGQAEEIRNILKNNYDLSVNFPQNAPDGGQWVTEEGSLEEGKFIRVKIDGDVVYDKEKDDNNFYTKSIETTKDTPQKQYTVGTWAYRNDKYVVSCEVKRLSEEATKNYDEDKYKNKIYTAALPCKVESGDNKLAIRRFDSVAADGKTLKTVRVTVVNSAGTFMKDYVPDVKAADYSEEAKYTLYFLRDGELADNTKTSTGTINIELTDDGKNRDTIDELDCVVIGDTNNRINFVKAKGSEYSIQKLVRDDVVDDATSYNQNKDIVKNSKMYSYKVEVYKLDKTGVEMKIGDKLLAETASQKYVSKSN